VTEGAEGTPLRILSLDDDPGNQSLIRAILTRADDLVIRTALVIQATTIAEARAILEHEAIDVLLLDIHLPDGLGLDLATELRTRTARRPAILALTASVLPADQQAALDAGCDAFLAKPFPAGGLVAAVRRLIDEPPDQAPSRD
jgi:two-component system KDP operon response regulator KdpE